MQTPLGEVRRPGARTSARKQAMLLKKYATKEGGVCRQRVKQFLAHHLEPSEQVLIDGVEVGLRDIILCWQKLKPLPSPLTGSSSGSPFLENQQVPLHTCADAGFHSLCLAQHGPAF